MANAPDLHLRVSVSGEPVGRVTAIGARREVRRLLTNDLAAADLDAVLLATSELVNNALMHAAPLGGSGVCEVRVWFDRSSRVHVEVADQSDVLPELPSPPSAAQLSGRGLNIVDTLVDRWGAEPTPDGGKYLWFELDLDRAGHAGWTTGSHV
jgi:two-component sensor histidine kinase